MPMNSSDVKNFIYAGIITYNPELVVLEKNIASIISQIECIVIVDNGSRNISAITDLVDKYKIHIIKNKDNYGIATALNQAMDYGKRSGFLWMLSLDHDSQCPPDYCKKMKNISVWSMLLLLLQ